LLTHTGGIVSAKYLANCKAQNANVAGIQIGQKLTVSPSYYSTAVNAICEIGIKLCYVSWRKFAKEQRDRADECLNQFCYDQIVRRNYKIAEAILSFSTKVLQKKGNDRCRRMMLINHANAVRLQKRKEEAIKLLDVEDWSAVSDDFKICVAAIRGEIDEVVFLMNKIGKGGQPTPEDYRTWPVFRGLRSNPKIAAAFSEIFGQPIIRQRLKELALPEAELAKVESPALS
jgi:hypothetical protein